MYGRYVTQEVAPFIRQHNGVRSEILLLGCQHGSYRRKLFIPPSDVFDMTIVLSGLFQLKVLLAITSC
jgi:hypothetical protein